jgi:hypothetical protein
MVLVIELIVSILYFRTTKIPIVLSLLNILFVLLSLIINFSILNISSTAYYFNQINTNSNLNDQIISAFSLQTSGNQNLLIRGLVGSASWNTPSFYEFSRTLYFLGDLKSVNLYTNQDWSIAFIVFLIANFLICIYLITKTSFSKIKIGIFSFLTLLILIFNFGYSTEFTTNINRIFYYIPGSYIFREAGKVYYLFFAIIVLTILINFIRTKNGILRSINFALTLLFALSSFIPFTVLSKSLNYITFPDSLNYALNNCQDKTIATIPSNLYTVPSYSNVFIVNPFAAKKSGNCDILRPSAAELISRDRASNIVIDENQNRTKTFEKIIKTYADNLPVPDNGVLNIDAKIQQENTDNLFTGLQSIELNLILIDKTNTPYYFNLKNDLSQKSRVVQEDVNYLLIEIDYS